MSTLQTHPRSPQIRSTRIGAAIGALGALIAIGVLVLVLALTGPKHTTRPTAATHPHPAATQAQPAEPHDSGPAVPTPAGTRYFRDPVTHALIPIASTNPGPGYAHVEHHHTAGP
jgi:cell division septation protein DedD